MESQTERERQLEQEEECIQPAAEFLRTVPVLGGPSQAALFNWAIRAALEIANLCQLYSSPELLASR